MIKLIGGLILVLLFSHNNFQLMEVDSYEKINSIFVIFNSSYWNNYPIFDSMY